MERRIAAAQTAAARLGHGEVPWDDIRSAHRRPDRAVAGSYWSIVSEALTVIFVLGFFLTLITSGVVAAMDAGAEGHLTPDQQATFLHAVPIVAAMLVVITLLGTATAHLTLLRVGSTARRTDNQVTTALDLVTALGALSAAEAGEGRARSLREVHKLSAFMVEQIRYSAKQCGGISGYRGSRAKLTSHARAVNKAIALQLSRLVEDRDDACKTLSRYALHIAAAQSRADFGALLPADDLESAAESETIDRSSAFKVFGPAAVAALVTIPIALSFDVSGSAVLFVPLTVFAIGSLIAATMTGNTHRIAAFMDMARGNRNGQ